jgi:hypothetical protein
MTSGMRSKAVKNDVNLESIEEQQKISSIEF